MRAKRGDDVVNRNTSVYIVLTTVMAFIPAMSTADTRGGGELTTTNVTLDNIVDESTDIWEVLESESITLTTTSNCTVTACSDVDNNSGPGDVGNLYLFTLSRDSTAPGLNGAAERQLELSDNSSINDDNQKPICSTRLFAATSAGTHTLYWLGARVNSSAPATTVLDTSLTVQCFDGTEL